MATSKNICDLLGLDDPISAHPMEPMRKIIADSHDFGHAILINVPCVKLEYSQMAGLPRPATLGI